MAHCCDVCKPTIISFTGYDKNTGKSVMWASSCPRFLHSERFAELVRSCGVVDHTNVSSILALLGKVRCVGGFPLWEIRLFVIQ